MTSSNIFIQRELRPSHVQMWANSHKLARFIKDIDFHDDFNTSVNIKINGEHELKLSKQITGDTETENML